MLFDFSEFFHVSNGINSFSILFTRNLHESTDSLSKVFASHSSVLAILNLFFGHDSSVLRNSNSSVDVVSGAHDNLDTSSLTLNDGGNNCLSQWVLDTENTDGSQIVLENLFV
jgi:hypothetical protein